MIRPLTCVCMVLACASGLSLYQAKHRAQMLDREIGRTMKLTETARDRTGVLRGEWALLNEPERLAALSQTHLGLKTLTPAQFVTVADLGARLPSPVAPGAFVPAPEEPEPAVPVPTPVPAARPAIKAPAPIMAAAAPQPAPARAPAAPRPATQAVERRDDAVPPRPSYVQAVSVSSSSPAGLPPRTASAGSGRSIGEAVARAARQRGDTQPGYAQPSYVQPTFAQPAYTQASVQAPTPAAVSALGGPRPLLPAPVPFGTR